jgi:tetratricopeptide (TPR) repeat protein
MFAPPGKEAVELLIDEAREALAEGGYQRAASAGGGATRAAEALGDPGLLAGALAVQADALRMLGDREAAQACYTRVLALAEDPATWARLDQPAAARAVAGAHMNWVDCARFMTDIPYRRLFALLDAAEAWLVAIGHRDWRAGILLQRASLFDRLGDLPAAIAAAEDALAAHNPDAPGYSVATHHFGLGDILRDAGRHAEAAPHYQAILDGPGNDNASRKSAHEGLAHCALARGDPHTARWHATAAVALAAPLGDDALCPALDTLVETCLAAGDTDAAWQNATRHLAAAHRIGGHYRPYHAIRTAVDVALRRLGRPPAGSAESAAAADRAYLDTAHDLLVDLERHAAALDATADTTVYTAEAAERRTRLARVQAGEVGRPNAGGEDSGRNTAAPPGSRPAGPPGGAGGAGPPGPDLAWPGPAGRPDADGYRSGGPGERRERPIRVDRPS